MTHERKNRTHGVFSLILVVSLAGCGTRNKEQSAGDSVDQTLNTVVTPVEVAVAQRKTLSVSKTYSGTLEGIEQANIVPKISERITSVNVRVGQEVHAGQVIAILDKSGASSQFYQAEAGFRNAEKTLQRMKSLYEEGAIALQALDGTQTAYDVSKANFDAARSAVELGTPISGIVTAVNGSLGDLTTPGAPVATVARIDQMKAIFNLNESDVTNLAVGQQVQVHAETNRDARAFGKIIQLSKSADVRSRSFEIKALFHNTPERWFKPGMFCNVEVQIVQRSKTLVVPNVAIQSDGVSNGVFLLRGGRALRRAVQVGVTDGTDTEILSGLAESDTVVTTGSTSVDDSSFVSVSSRSH
jgi:membrane fusion protein (multidrug efflux system)